MGCSVFFDTASTIQLYLQNAQDKRSSCRSECRKNVARQMCAAFVPTTSLDAQLRNGMGSMRGCPAVASLTLDDESALTCENGQLDRAMDVLSRMDQHGAVASANIYRSLLKACSRRKSLAEAKRVQAHLARHGLELTRFVGEHVVNTLVKCGGLDDALLLFERLPNRTALSWTAVISGYTMAWQGREALRMYQRMQEEGLEPNRFTFVSLLKACSSLSDLDEAKRIHAEVVRYGCESDPYVCTCLVNMYGKFGSIVDAQKAFDRLVQRDVVSWNAMLAAYGQQGYAEEAVKLYEELLEEASPDQWTFVSVLQACSMLADEEACLADQGATKARSMGTGKTIHAEVRRRGYHTDVFVGSTLVSMYRKCGSVADARAVFDGLSQRDVVAWNAMLVAYVDQSQAGNALLVYEQLQKEGVCPNVWTFVSTLQACSKLAEEEEDAVVVGGYPSKLHCLVKGKAVHAESWRTGNCVELFVGNTLISMYGKCGSIADAQSVFDGLWQRDVVSWNAIFAAYVEQAQAEKALQLYEQMWEEGESPDSRTFLSALQAYGMLAEEEEVFNLDGEFIKVVCLNKGKAVHAAACRKGYGVDVFLGNTLVSVYGKCGSLVDAQIVFDGLSHRDLVSWTAMLQGYVEQGQAQKALDVYQHMQEGYASPSERILLNALQACSLLADKEECELLDGQTTKTKSLEMVRKIHSDCRRQGYETDIFVGSTLICMYGKCGSMLEARSAFDALPQHDAVSWNTILAVYVQQGQPDKALHLYEQMQEEGVSPTEVTVACILQACSKVGSLDTLREVHDSLICTGNALSTLVANTLISTYGRCTSMPDAQAVFDAMPQHDVVSWNALSAGYAREGNCVASLQCYDNMELAGIKPDGVTFLTLLSACSHVGLVERGVEYFHSMSRDHNIAPEISHYVTMVDLLGRAGCFTSLDDLLSTMPLEPNLSIWLCLLAACRKHSRVVLGKHAFDKAVNLEPKHPAAYLMMSSIYADAGLWDCSMEVNSLGEKAVAWKKLGKSWIEHEGEVYTFVVGNDKKVQQEQLYNLLEKVNSDPNEKPLTDDGC